MKKLLTSLVLIVIGAACWWLISHTARFSIKKWDAKFESVLRHQLNLLGLSNQDVISSVHEVRKDVDGEWVVHHMTIKLSDVAKRETLKKQLEETGATILEKNNPDNTRCYIVKRGLRTYQEITFAK